MAEENNSGGGGNWLGGALGAAGGLLGMIGQNSRAKKQHNRQKELMGIQFQNQQQLNQQGHELQKKMWEDTNYPAQMKMMQEAGLNPGLMYGMSGGGATTTGSQGGGSAASGNAAAPMDIGAALQAGMMKAQIKKLEAETELTKTQTGTEGERAGEIASKIKNMDANTDRTQQMKEFEKYEQDQKKLGIYPNDSKFWRLITANASEEQLNKITQGITNGIDVGIDIFKGISNLPTTMYEMFKSMMNSKEKDREIDALKNKG